MTPPRQYLRSLQKATFDAGRMLNRLHFMLHVAYLTRDGSPGVAEIPVDGKSLAESWSDLRLVVREVVISADQRDVLSKAVDNLRETWEYGFGSEAHCDELETAHARVEEDTRLASDRTDEQIVRTHYQPLLNWIDESVGALLNHLDQFLEPGRRDILRLAKFLDQALHPVSPFPSLSRPRGPEQTLFSISAPSELPPASQWLWPKVPLVVSATWPSQLWFDGVEQRLLQLGIEAADLPRHGEDCRSHGDLPAIQHYIEQCEACVVSPDQVDYVSPKPGYLGICLDEAQRIARREGYPEAVEIERPISWRLLEFLVKSRAAWLSQERLSDAWEGLGGNSAEPSPPTITSEISRLRKLLKCLRLKVENRRRIGWRLEAMESDISSSE